MIFFSIIELMFYILIISIFWDYRRTRIDDRNMLQLSQN